MKNWKIYMTGLLLTATLFLLPTACSQDADVKPVVPDEPSEYQVTVTTGADNNEQDTRATMTEGGSIYRVTYAEGDTLLVWGKDVADKYFYGALALTSGAGTASGSFSGTLNVESGSSLTKLTEAKTVDAILAPAGWATKGYRFNEASHSYEHTTYWPVAKATDMAPYLHIIKKEYDSSANHFKLTNAYSIVHAVWSGLEESVTYTIHAYNQKAEDGRVDYCGKEMASDASSVLEFYLPLPLTHGYYFEVKGNNKTYRYSQTYLAYTHLHSYVLRRKFLNNITGQYTAVNGETLVGETQYGVRVPAGATVTLDGLTVDQKSVGAGRDYAPVTCTGDATVKIFGECKLISQSDGFPGLQAGPKGTTLTITGKGRLTSTGKSAPGIGCQDKNGEECGNIVISGGTVWAVGDDYGAGIGTGFYGTCGTITITDGATEVAATKGGSAESYIGRGNAGTVCGTLTVDGVGGVDGSWPTSGSYGKFNSSLSGNIWTLTRQQ
ncbi:MAG: hypothetical protein J6M23_09665 [Bacteroidales bacterium]|nr:hypothetical protein [Bacteroidales bacterium]